MTRNETHAIRYCLAVVIASIIISLMGCAVIEPYQSQDEQLSAVLPNRKSADNSCKCPAMNDVSIAAFGALVTRSRCGHPEIKHPFFPPARLMVVA